MTTPAKKAGATLKSLMKKAEATSDKKLAAMGLNEVKHHPAAAQAPGVFRPLPKNMMGMEKRFKRWESVTKFGGTKLILKGVYVLDSFDLTVLFALIAFSIRTPIKVDANPTTEEGKALRKDLIQDKDNQLQLFEDGPHIPVSSVAKFTRYEITKLVTGGTGGIEYQRVKDSLERLSWTRINVVTKELDYFTNIISGWSRMSDAWSVAIHPLLTQAIRGDGQGDQQYVKMALDRVLALKTQVGKLLYPILSTRVYEGHSQSFDLDTLVGWIYHHEPAEDGTLKLKKQRKQVQAGMDDIGQLADWTIEKTRKGYKVDRKTLK